MDYYLKAADESAMWTALVNAGAAKQIEIKDTEGTLIETKFILNNGFSLDVLGTVYRKTGNFIQQTVNDSVVEVPELEAIEGFHANLRGPADLAEKVTYNAYTPTLEDLENPDFVMPEPEKTVTPGPLADFIVYPKTPSRVWL